MKRLCSSTNTAAVAVALSLLAACSPDSPVSLDDNQLSAARAGYTTPGTHRQYGAPVEMGNGHARAYIVFDSKNGQDPIEIGVALDEKALDGLPTTGMPIMTTPAMPARNPTQYEFIMLDWNPMGHEPPGVYDLPHFDFHFYLTPQHEVHAISPDDPDFATKANNLPTGDEVPPNYIIGGPNGASIAVPAMGVHWSDVRSPELQAMLGNPSAFEPFSKTFIYGSWDGRFTFLEPMITRAHLLTRPDETISIPQPKLYPEPGWYATTYTISFDEQAKEYRVALTGLTWRE